MAFVIAFFALYLITDSIGAALFLMLVFFPVILLAEFVLQIFKD